MATFRDYEMLNEALTRTGQTFRQARQDKLENALRTRALDEAAERTKVADQHYEAQAQAQREGETEAWLTGADGGVVQYKGNPNGLRALQTQAEQRGKPLTLTGRPQTPARIGSFRTQTPMGEMTFYMNSPQEVESVMGLAKQIGGTSPQSGPGEFNTRRKAETEYQSKLEADVSNAQTPEAAAAAARKLAIFKESAAAGDKPPMDTVTEHFDAVPPTEAIPAKPPIGHLWWKKPGTEAIPATPGTPATSIRREVPAGTQPGAPMPTVPPGAALPKGATPQPTRRADGKIRVMGPDGKTGWSSSSPAELQAAGYKIVQ